MPRVTIALLMIIIGGLAFVLAVWRFDPAFLIILLFYGLLFLPLALRQPPGGE